MRWRFSVSFLLLLMTAISVWLASQYSAHETIRKERLKACNIFADAYLTSIHLGGVAHNNIPGTSVEALILPPDGRYPDGKSGGQREQDLLSSFSFEGPSKSGTDEFAVNGDLAAGSFVFYAPIRATTSCTECHSSWYETQLQTGQLMGFLRLSVEQ